MSNDKAQGTVTELITNRLYAVTAWHSLETPVSYVAPGSTGWLPLNTYVLKDGESALIVDTGTGAYAEAVRAGLATALSGTTHRTLWISRREFDATTNMPWLVPAFDVDVVKCGGDFDPNDFFAGFDDANAVAQLRALAPSTGLIKDGDTLKVGALEIEARKTALQVLRTFWFMERTTRTLFPSDAFAFLLANSRNDRLVADAGFISAEAAYGFLSNRFGWLRGAEVDVIVSEIRDTVLGGDVERLCPTWGRIVEGRENVKLAVDALCEAMLQLGSENYRTLVTDDLLGRLAAVPGVVPPVRT